MLKKLSQWLGGLSSPAEGGGAPRAQLCLFGKHPGWDDHMQDLGLNTERLVEVRRTLYAEGIAGNIDSGSWEKLGAAALPVFEHAFVWRFRADEFVFGRLWSSSDARGRKKYPMVACVHARGFEMTRMAALASESVTRAMEACRQETDAQSVRSIFLRESEGLSARASGIGPGGSDRFDRACRESLATDSTLNADGAQPLVRAAYALHREAEPALKRGLAQSSRGVHLRLPCIGGMGVGGSAWAWSAAALDLLNVPTGVPDGLLSIEAIGASGGGGPWVDALIGRVTTAELVCLRASRAAIPLTTDVPFNIDAAFADRVRSKAAMWRGVTSPEKAGTRD
ncbi:MAG: hypothetical protein KF805_04640 [Phycisphaeraceae bacterium]|nr:hypothetical protein [Phycisphaeraceae bacterium]